MRVPTVENFLFCISLETGAKILGYLGLVSSTVGFIVSVLVLGAATFNFQALINATTKAGLMLMKTTQFGN